MATRMTSVRLIGRAAELAELQSALVDAAGGRPSLAFVAGDSGVGKTRLLTEFERRARAADPPARVIGGDCVELGEGELPYAPLVAALRPLARSGDPVLARLGPLARAELGAFLPGLGPAPAPDALTERDDAAQGRLFEALLELLDELGSERPLVLSIEDLQWADRSTRAFLAFLARSLCDERVLVVSTYRQDELHRRHPLRPLLARLERDVRARRIELEPFTRDELVEQLADILGTPPSRALAERLWARSEGNPLFTEELLAAALDGRGALPPTLREALMLRIERLPAPAQELLRLLAVGRRLDHEVLVDASGLDARALREALREAVASHIVTPGDDGFYVFRHALLREVVEDDLLPGERGELHLALARALERRSAGRGGGVQIAAGIAHHYLAAGEQPAALAAAVHAAAAAERVHAYGEAADLLERAIELWDRVPDAPARAGSDRVDLLHRAAFARHVEGDPGRQETLARRGLELLDENADPYRAAALLQELARAEWSLNRGEQALATARRALALLPAGEASCERARLLAWLAKVRMLQNRHREAIELAREAIEAAAAAADPVAEGVARNALGTSLVALGEFEAGLDELRRATEIARERERINDLGSAYTNLAEALQSAGHTREGLALAREGQAELGRLARPSDWLRVAIAEFAFAAGEWDAAQASMPSPERRYVGTALMNVLLRRAELALGRGDHAAAREHIEHAERLAADSTEPQFHAVCGALRAELEVRAGDLDAARRAVESAVDRIELCTDDVTQLARVAAVGTRVEAESAQRARDLGEDPAPALARAEAMLARVRAAAGERPVEGAWLASAEAEATRARGRWYPTRWAAAAAAWDRLERPYPAAEARWRQAEAHLAADEREAATVTLRTALVAARELGAGYLVGEIEGLAARARLALHRDPPSTVARTEATDDPLGLTPRERQVLALLAEGATNRQIGDTLYMAEKTASVHVSRILAKLDVRSRTQAAAVAHRLGLDTHR